MSYARALVLAGAAALGGCSLAPRQSAPLDLAGHCEAYLHAFDETVAAHGAGDAGAWRLPGFPHLRSDRFLASYRNASLDEPQMRDWLSRLHELDRQARTVELANLPPAARDALLLRAPFASHEDAIAHCGTALMARDLADPARLGSIRIRSRVPDHYRNWQRIVGLYPVSQLFARGGVSSLHERLAADFSGPLEELAVRGTLQRYTPADDTRLDRAEIAAILRESRRNPLTIPQPRGDDLARLFAHYAPVWEFEQISDDDRIGRIRYDRERGAHYVDVESPVVYRSLGHTRFDGQTLLQLNYEVWVPARTAQSSADIYAGPFDGLVWRVTLLPDGTPLAYDSVHPCGCYYLLFTTGRTRARATSNINEPVLVAQHVAASPQDKRMVIRVRARDHYIQRVYADGVGHGAEYPMLDYRELLTVDAGDGRGRSLFDPRGLVGASARTERFLLWPFGIASAGAMRRAGTRAIAFVGVRHFDDAHLLEALVELPAP